MNDISRFGWKVVAIALIIAVVVPRIGTLAAIFGTLGVIAGIGIVILGKLTTSDDA
jgi:hypothetical protein